MTTTTRVFMPSRGLDAIHAQFAELSEGWTSQIATSVGVQRMVEEAFAPLRETVAKATWAPRLEVTRAANLAAANLARDVVRNNADLQRAIAKLNSPALEAIDLLATSWSANWAAGVVPVAVASEDLIGERDLEIGEDILEPISENLRSQPATQRQVDRLSLQLFAYTYLALALTYLWLEYPQLFAALGAVLVGRDTIQLSSNPINSAVDRLVPPEESQSDGG